jgi:diketogulonate reductase-like aldo/keto reductase
VLEALKAGYRLIDCAYCYANEDEVGQGLADAFAQGIVKREDIFVVTKIWATYTTRCALGLEKSLKSLGLEYVDLVLVVRSLGITQAHDSWFEGRERERETLTGCGGDLPT